MYVCIIMYICIYIYICMFVCVCVCAYTGKYYSVDQVLGYIAQVAYCGLLLRSYLGEADVVGDLNILDV